MTTVAVPHAWPVALHPDARPIPRSQRSVDVVLDEDVVRVVSELPGLPAVLNRLLREQSLGELIAANLADGFSEAATIAVLTRLGRGGVLRRLVAPGLGAEELRDFERELGALARHETASVSRFELFARVRRAHVLVVGCGLTGAHVVQHLAASGVGELSLVDPAVVLPGHPGRHAWFFRGDVGQAKATVLRDRIHQSTPHTRARALSRAIDSEAVLAAILASIPAIDAIVYTIDVGSLAFGMWAARCARAREFALLRVNRIVVGPLTRPGRGDACPGCVAPRLERGVRDLPTVLSLCGEARDETAFLWSAELAAFGALAAHELMVHLTGAGDVGTNNRQVAPSPGGLRAEKPFPRDHECPVCGAGATP